MAKKSNRQALIDTIMRKDYGDDDPKNDGSNRAFLESLTTKELEDMVTLNEFEDFMDDDDDL
jgi:hypothetical protein